jgi:hypothetical protein
MISRRELIAGLGAACAMLALPARADDDVAIAIDSSPEGSDEELGATLALEEARRACELLKRPLRVVASAPWTIVSRAELGATSGWHAAASCEARVAAAIRFGLARSPRAWSLRDLPPSIDALARTLLAEKAAAIADDGDLVLAWDRGPAGAILVGDPAGPADPAARGDATWPAEWHASLVRFGAEQLNRRFTQRHGRAMTARAWRGWMAVKASVECALRATTPASVVVDGHVGRPLRFDPATRHLDPPLHLVSATALVTEAR